MYMLVEGHRLEFYLVARVAFSSWRKFLCIALAYIPHNFS